MSKSYPKGPRERRVCIFCDQTARSKEHFWPVWMHKELPPSEPDAKHDRPHYSYHPSTGPITKGVVGRPGGVEKLSIRAVCNECNNGWMNQVEERARPHLTKMLKGEAVELSMEDQKNVAQWIALKSIVSEHSNPETAVTPKNDRVAFRETGTIPDYFNIYATTQVTGSHIGLLRNSHGFALSPDGPQPPFVETTQNIQTISFIFGSIFVHVNAARIDNFALEEKVIIPAFYGTCRLWPPQSKIMEFPRRPRLGTDGIQTVSNSIERYIEASKTTWA